jgi:hypothetical protein
LNRPRRRAGGIKAIALATWQADTPAIDAVPVPHGVVSVDLITGMMAP